MFNLAQNLWKSQPHLHITFPDYNLRRVGVLDKLLQSLRVNVMEGHVSLPALGHLICTPTQNQISQAAASKSLLLKLPD